MKPITTERVPILIWGEAIDEQALAQARNLANLPFAVRHIALMPDAHVGFGMPIGGVLAAEGQVIPHAVGLDIGCGVRTWKTGVTAEELLPVRDAILQEIQRAVPQGFHWHETSQADRTELFDEVPDIPVLREQAARAERQIGTLGGQPLHRTAGRRERRGVGDDPLGLAQRGPADGPAIRPDCAG